MQKTATVLGVEASYATVAVRQQDACANCHATCVGCARTLQVRAENPVHAKVGDTVVLESNSTRILRTAMAVFVLPLILTFLGYALGRGLSLSAWQAGILSAGVFALSFLSAAALCNRGLRQNPDLRIVEILESR